MTTPYVATSTPSEEIWASAKPLTSCPNVPPDGDALGGVDVLAGLDVLGELDVLGDVVDEPELLGTPATVTSSAAATEDVVSRQALVLVSTDSP